MCHEVMGPDAMILVLWMLGFERVSGRKAGGLQMEEIDCKCQTYFLSLLSGRKKQTTSVKIFSPSLYKFK